MPYDVKQSKTFNHTYVDTYKSAYISAKAMKAKVLKHDPENGVLHLQFDKKLYGKYLGDRSHFEIEFNKTESDAVTTLSVFAYPINPIGQKLMFGARKGVVQKVMQALFDEMEKRFPEE